MISYRKSINRQAQAASKPFLGERGTAESWMNDLLNEWMYVDDDDEIMVTYPCYILYRFHKIGRRNECRERDWRRGGFRCLFFFCWIFACSLTVSNIYRESVVEKTSHFSSTNPFLSNRWWASRNSKKKKKEGSSLWSRLSDAKNNIYDYPHRWFINCLVISNPQTDALIKYQYRRVLWANIK